MCVLYMRMCPTNEQCYNSAITSAAPPSRHTCALLPLCMWKSAWPNRPPLPKPNVNSRPSSITTAEWNLAADTATMRPVTPPYAGWLLLLLLVVALVLLLLVFVAVCCGVLSSTRTGTS